MIKMHIKNSAYLYNVINNMSGTNKDAPSNVEKRFNIKFSVTMDMC
jgi:hypothetical protein